MSDPKTPAEMLDALGKPFPPNAIMRKQGKFDYVQHQTVTRRLNSVAPDWSFVIRETWFRDDLHMTNKSGQPVLTMVVLGELTIPGLGTRSGYGVANLQPGGGEDQYKGAESDALKKAASRFGVALDLYGDDYEADAPAQPQRAPQRVTRPADAPKPAAKESDAIDLRDVLMEDMLARKTIAFLDATAQVWNYPGVADLPMDKLRDLRTLVYGEAPKKRQEAFDAWVFDWEHEHPVNQAELIPGTDAVPNPDRFTR